MIKFSQIKTFYFEIKIKP